MLKSARACRGLLGSAEVCSGLHGSTGVCVLSGSARVC